MSVPPDDSYREREVIREPVREREVIREPVRERVVREPRTVRTVGSGASTGLIIAIVLAVIVLIGAYYVIQGM